MLPWYTVSSITVGVAIAVLGIISLAAGARDRVQVSFALFCFAWSVVAVSWSFLELVDPRTTELCLHAVGGSGREVTSDPVSEATVRWGHVPVAFAFVTGFFALLYVLALTGRDERSKERIGPIRIRDYVLVFAFATVTGTTLALSSDLIVEGARFHAGWGHALDFAPTAPLVQVPYGMLTVIWWLLIARSISETTNRVRRSFLVLNLVGILLLQISAGLFLVLLPQFGIPTTILAFDAFGVLALYMYVVMARYQRQQNRQAATFLARRVEERTAALARAQARLNQSEKMASLAALVAGVAHEANAPLGTVRSMHDTRSRATAKIMRRVGELAGDDSLSDKTLARSHAVVLQGDQVIRDSIECIDKLVHRLRTFAKLDQSDLESMDVHRGLNDTLDLMSTRLGSIEVLRRYGELPPIACVVRQIHQVLFNVLTNAVEAIDGDGRIAIATERAGARIRIRITDDGSGIAPEHLDVIFDPGFTTKSPQGTGLGLAVCHHIIHEHGGDISVESCPGVGTKVEIALPIEAQLIVRSAGSSPTPLPQH